MQIIYQLTAPYREYERAKKNMKRCNAILSKSGFGHSKSRQNYTIKVAWKTTKQLMVALKHHSKTKHLLN